VSVRTSSKQKWVICASDGLKVWTTAEPLIVGRDLLWCQFPERPRGWLRCVTNAAEGQPGRVRAGNPVRAGQAACRYSWITPPGRSCRWMARRSAWPVSRGRDSSGRVLPGRGAVGAVPGAVPPVRVKRVPELGLVPGRRAVQQFGAGRVHPASCDRVHAGHPGTGQHRGDRGAAADLAGQRWVVGVAVLAEEADRCGASGVLEVHEQVAGSLRNPGHGWGARWCREYGRACPCGGWQRGWTGAVRCRGRSRRSPSPGSPRPAAQEAGPRDGRPWRGWVRRHRSCGSLPRRRERSCCRAGRVRRGCAGNPRRGSRLGHYWKPVTKPRCQGVSTARAASAERLLGHLWLAEA
jgi:hypothetical protein